MTTTFERDGVKVDVEAIALGLIELFDEDELVALRFGMLPAKKMESLHNSLSWRVPDSMLKDVEKAITLAIYSHGNLVV